MSSIVLFVLAKDQQRITMTVVKNCDQHGNSIATTKNYWEGMMNIMDTSPNNVAFEFQEEETLELINCTTME
jgi:hypothetical protein